MTTTATAAPAGQLGAPAVNLSDLTRLVANKHGLRKTKAITLLREALDATGAPTMSLTGTVTAAESAGILAAVDRRLGVPATAPEPLPAREETKMPATPKPADKPAPVRYLSRPEVAERIGVKPDTLNRYKLPEPDAIIGSRQGWLPATIDAWNAARPGTTGRPAVRAAATQRAAETKARNAGNR